MILAKVSDDILVVGKQEEIENFTNQMQSRFTVSKIIMDEDIIFNGCCISRDVDGDLRMSMESYASDLKPVFISEESGKQSASCATEDEISAFRSPGGELVWLGCGALPQAALVGLKMQK